MGIDTIELDVTSLDIPEETLLRYVRLIKSDGLQVRPQFSVKFNKSDIPLSSNRAFGAYVVPSPRSSGELNKILISLDRIYYHRDYLRFIFC